MHFDHHCSKVLEGESSVHEAVRLIDSALWVMIKCTIQEEVNESVLVFRLHL